MRTEGLPTERSSTRPVKMKHAPTLSDAGKDVSDGRPVCRFEVGDNSLDCRRLWQCVERRVPNSYIVVLICGESLFQILICNSSQCLRYHMKRSAQPPSQSITHSITQSPLQQQLRKIDITITHLYLETQQ